MTVTIRRVNPRDYADQIIKLQKLCLPECDPLDPSGEGDGWWWLAFDGDFIVAFANLRTSCRVEKAGYLARAGVHHDYRGHGLQRKLIGVRERFARKMGWGYMFSDTIDNPISSNNLMRCGYKMFDPKTPWGNEGAIYFVKELK